MVDIAEGFMLPNQNDNHQLLHKKDIWTGARMSANQRRQARSIVAQPQRSHPPRVGLTSGQIINPNEGVTQTRQSLDSSYAAVSAPVDYAATATTTNLLGSINWPEADLSPQYASSNIAYTQAAPPETWQAQYAVRIASSNQDQFPPSLTPTQLPLGRTIHRSFPPSIEITESTSAYTTRPQDTRFDTQFRAYPPSNLLTPELYAMNLEQPQQSVDVPVQHVPVSPVSHHSGGASRGQSPMYADGQRIAIDSNRKRSFSQIDQRLQDHSPHDSNASMNATSPGGMYMDDGRPAQRVTRTVKRPEAPMNADHKFICDVAAECAGLVFDRKCEWSKHMDKHDRPYRCPHPSCAKLQGFTYSGGLLRHEREVHNKHGGPRAFLMCPHPNCKRHTDKGFTRKENLQEHLRRVHGGKEDPQAQDPGTTHPDLAASALAGSGNEDFYIAQQNRTNGDARTEVDDLLAQLHQLRRDGEAKDALIQRLQEEARAQEDRVISLESTLRQMQH